MPLRSTFIPVLALAVAGCLGLTGCGGEESNPQLLPQKHADFLTENLEEAEEAFAANDCETVDARLEDALERINDLGAPPISKPLKLRLREGVQALQDEAGTCGEEEEEPTEPTEPVVPDPEPAPAPDEPEDEEPEPEPEPDPEPAPEPEPDPAPAPEPQEPVEPAPTPPSDGGSPGGGTTGPPVTPGGGGVGPSDPVGGA
jgi:outer membrane biosynthesis protein TonB